MLTLSVTNLNEYRKSLRILTGKTYHQALTKSMNMYICAVGILNQLFIRGFYTEVKF